MPRSLICHRGKFSLMCKIYAVKSVAFSNRTEKCVKLQDEKQPAILAISDIILFQATQRTTRDKEKNSATLFHLMLLMTEQFLSIYLFQRNIHFIQLQPLCYSIFLKTSQIQVSILDCRCYLKLSKFKMAPYVQLHLLAGQFFRYTHSIAS